MYSSIYDSADFYYNLFIYFTTQINLFTFFTIALISILIFVSRFLEIPNHHPVRIPL
jgi:hypothetical protein